MKNWNWALVSANRENARIKRESIEERDDMACNFVSCYKSRHVDHDLT